MAKTAEKLEEQAERLRALKDQTRGVTFRKISEAVGVTERQAQRWFAGDSDIDDENLEKLADYLGTTADYIEYGEVVRNGKTPDPFSGTVDSRLTAIEQKLEELRINQLALLAAIQELPRRQPSRTTKSRSQAS